MKYDADSTRILLYLVRRKANEAEPRMPPIERPKNTIVMDLVLVLAVICRSRRLGPRRHRKKLWKIQLQLGQNIRISTVFFNSLLRWLTKKPSTSKSHITDNLWRESTRGRWIPHTKRVSNADRLSMVWHRSMQSWLTRAETWAKWQPYYRQPFKWISWKRNTFSLSKHMHWSWCYSETCL